MAAPNSFTFAYWKQGTPNSRIPAELSFSIESSDITSIGGKLYDETNNLITTSYEGLTPVIESANLSSFTIPIGIMNTVKGVRFAGYSYDLEIVNNDTPNDIYFEASTHTTVTSGGILQGSFDDNISDVDMFILHINPEVYLCKFEEQPRLTPTNIQTTTGTEGIETIYTAVNVRNVGCIRNGSEYSLQVQIPLFGGLSIQVLRHDSICYNDYRNTVIRNSLPTVHPSTYSYFTLTPPQQPTNWENLMEIVVPMRLKRTIELYAVGSNIYGYDYTSFNLIIQVSRIRDIIAS
jgi:hypothetical protein